PRLAHLRHKEHAPATTTPHRPPNAVSGRAARRRLLFAILVVLASPAQSQEPSGAVRMTQGRLHDLIVEIGSDVLIAGNTVRFSFDGATMLCISDVEADRMRIISPIDELGHVLSEQLFLALTANFHSVLDARYAVSDGVVYAAFIHPLGPLTDEEVYSAIRQVASAHNTFGEEYTSGELFFGGVPAP
ncbi:MAG: hypothetical protein ACE5G3_04790, partial [Gammaproteobacteria bacterium]